MNTPVNEVQRLKDYLLSVKKDDSVMVEGRDGSIRKQTVTGLTKTQIITKATRFRLSDGMEAGVSGYHFRKKIVLPTEENQQRWLDTKLENWARNSFPSAFELLSTAQRLAVFQMVTSQLAQLNREETPVSDADD